jgi:hypothetical protein
VKIYRTYRTYLAFCKPVAFSCCNGTTNLPDFGKRISIFASRYHRTKPRAGKMLSQNAN